MTTDPTHPIADDLIRFIDEEVSPSGEEPLTLHTDLVMSGLVDSLGVVMIVEWLERRLDIEIDPADVVIEHFATISAMLAYLDARHDRPLRADA